MSGVGPAVQCIGEYETAILGGGPAGTGSLVWAARHGRLGDWLDSGVAVVEETISLGGGSLHRYALNSDSRGSSFLEGLDGPRCELPLTEVAADPVTGELERWRDARPPLALVHRFQRRLGTALCAEFARHSNSRVFTDTTAKSIQLQRDGTVVVQMVGRDCVPVTIRAAGAVMALGARENASLERIPVDPAVDLDRWRGKLVLSHRLFSGTTTEIGRRLRQTNRSPRVVILGGSHSAFYSAWVLLDRIPGLDFGSAGVQILYRGEPRVMYPSRAAAHVDGYGFSEADVCQLTGRVHRHGGLRGDGREMWRRMHGKAGSEPDNRAVARPINKMSCAELVRLFDDADLIVLALGYHMVTVPVFDSQGNPVPLGSVGAVVGPDSRLLAADGTAIPGVFAVGLGSGFTPSASLGGEASFAGSHASIWEDQHGLGEMIFHATRGRGARKSDLTPRERLLTAPGLTS